jgi:RNA polymerase sigma factor (sigma-70 family)
MESSAQQKDDLDRARCLRANHLEACLPSLMSYVRRLVSDSEIARDVMQNVSLIVLTASEAPQSEEQFAAWCRGIARNVAASERRVRRRSESMIPGEEVENDASDPDAASPEDSTNSRKVLRSLVRELDADEFDLLVRRYVLEEDSNELASELAQSPAALRMRLMRLRAVLRDRAMRVLPLVVSALGIPGIAQGQ